MAFVSAEELVGLKKTAPNVVVYSYEGYGKNVLARNITPEVAESILSRALDATLMVRQVKVNRPWELVNLTKKLDPNQPWLGFEYETGFDLKSDYDKLINHLWFNTNHVAIDREGYGNYCPEITFSPENLEAYMNGTSTIQQVIGWMNKAKIPLANFGEQYVGTHVNLSTRGYRKAGDDARMRCVSLINQSVLTMTRDEHVELFGRKPYGLGTPQGGGWIEFKMFKSTDNLDKFNKYVEVSKNMAELVEYLITRTPAQAAQHSYFISNFADILRGKVKSDKLSVLSVMDHEELSAGASMYWRGRQGETFPFYRNKIKDGTAKQVAVV